MTLQSYIEAAYREPKEGTLRIDKAAYRGATMSATFTVLSGQTVPAARDAIGLIKDVTQGARAFNGTSAVISRAFSSGTVDNFTVLGWVYLTNNAGNYVPFYVGRVNNGYGVVYVQSNNTWQLFFSGVSTPAGAAATLNTWTLLAIKRVAGTARLYVNGVAVGSTTASAPTAPNGYISVGAQRNAADSAWGSFFPGRVAHVCLALSVISDANLRAIYEAGPGGIGVAPDRYLSGTYFYYPLRGLASPETASSGSASSATLTVTNATASTDGPPVLSADGITLFAGEITKAPRQGLGGEPTPESELRIAAEDYNAIAGRKVVTTSRPSESLTARLAALITAAELDDESITLHGSQDTGPTLAARDYDRAKLVQIFQDLAAECRSSESETRVATVDELKRLSMRLPSDRTAPFDIEDGDGNTNGDVAVDEITKDYANHVLMQIGEAKLVEKSETFLGDGSTSAWDLTYTFTSGRGYVTRSDIGNRTLGVGAEYSVNSSNQLVSNIGNLPNGVTISITYDTPFPLWVEAEDSGEIAAHGRRSVILQPRVDVFDKDLGETILEAELDARTADQLVITYPTIKDGLEPGMEQTFDIANRGLDTTATISAVAISQLTSHQLLYQVTAHTGKIRTWQDTYMAWGGA